MPTSMPLFRLPLGGGGASFTANRIQQLVFTNAPAQMEFGVEIGAGTAPLVFRGDVDAQTLQSLLEACDDLAGYGITVAGQNPETGSGDDGTALHSGAFLIVLDGPTPYPHWGGVLNAEVQTFVVEDGGSETTPLATASGAGSGSLNGDYEVDPDAPGPLMTLRKTSDHNVKLRDTGSGWVIDAPGYGYTYYTNSSTSPTPPTTGWGEGPNALTPGPTLSLSGGNGYTLNGGSTFFIGATPGQVQASQQAQGGAYADVVVRGYTNDRAYEDVIVSGIGYYYSFNGTYVQDVVHNGAASWKSETGYRLYWSGTQWELGSGSFDGAYFSNSNGDINGWAGPWTGSEIPDVTPYAFTPSNAGFTSYFPFAAGDVPAPGATGSGATTATLFNYASAATLAALAEPTLESLIIATLQTPATGGNAMAYTPGNPAHWDGALPANMPDAVNRLAYAFNEMFWDQIS